jgi:hypothetical protein
MQQKTRKSFMRHKEAQKISKSKLAREAKRILRAPVDLGSEMKGLSQQILTESLYAGRPLRTSMRITLVGSFPENPLSKFVC